MRRKLFTLAAVVSAFVCAGSAGLWVRAVRDHRAEVARLSRDVAAASRWAADEERRADAYLEENKDSPGKEDIGLAMRLFRLAGLARQEQMRLAQLYAAVVSSDPAAGYRRCAGLTAILPVAWACSQFWRRRRAAALVRAGRCGQCGYDLRTTPDRCPKCGTVPAAKGERA